MADALDITEAAFTFAHQPALPIEVISARFTERIGEPYELHVDLTVGDPDVDAGAALGEGAQLELTQEAGTRRVTGLVRQISSPTRIDDQGRVRINAVVVPALRLLELNRTTRIFQEKTVPEILEAVLAEGLSSFGEREVELRLNASYDARDYCVQYQESDYAFAHRLMAEEGIYYTFDFEGDVEKLTLHDGNASLPTLSTGLSAEPDQGGHRTLSALRRRRRARTQAVALEDWDFRGPASTTDTADAPDGPFSSLAAYDHGPGRSLSIANIDQVLASRQATLRQESHRRDEDQWEGASTQALLALGKITVMDHPVPELNDDILLVEVAHHFSSAGTRDGQRYHNRFIGVPAGTPFRPRRRPALKPRIATQTATVVGPSGEEIHTDEHGRVKVQFHWDRAGASDDHSSCWLRVRQPWAGDGWGFVFTPRMGMEVVVEFLGGDPDRPVVMGTVYNGVNAPPYGLPGEMTKSTIKTNSSLGGGGFNELRFEDEKGKEQVFIHAEKDFNEVVKNNHSTHVGGNQKNEVKGKQTQTIGTTQTEIIHGNQEMTVDAGREVEVTGNFTELIDTGEDRTVVGNSDETINKGETRVINGTSEENITAGETRTIRGGLTETVNGPYDLKVHGNALRTSTGAFTKTVTGGAISVTSPNIVIDCTEVDIEAAGPVTANGGPLVKEVHQTVTEIDTTTIKLAPLRIRANATAHNYYGTKINLGALTYTELALKVEDVGLKVDLVGIKQTIFKAKADLYLLILDSGPLLQKKGPSAK